MAIHQTTEFVGPDARRAVARRWITAQRIYRPTHHAGFYLPVRSGESCSPHRSLAPPKGRRPTNREDAIPPRRARRRRRATKHLELIFEPQSKQIPEVILIRFDRIIQ